MWYQIQIAAYVSLILGYALLLLLVVRRQHGSTFALRLLAITLLLASLWLVGLGSLALFDAGVWLGFVRYRLAEFGLAILALLTAEFADAYVQHPTRRWLWHGVVGAVVLLALALDFLPAAGWAFLPPLLSRFVADTGLVALCWVVAWAVSTGRAWLTGVRALRHAAGSKHRNRIRYLLIALVGFLVGDLLVLIGGTPDVYVGLAARLLSFSIATFALLRYDLPDVKRLSLAGLCFVVLSGLTTLIYLLVLFVMARLTGILPPLPRRLVVVPPIVLALLLASAVDLLLRPRLQNFLNRTILGKTYDVQKALRAYSQQINLILNLERLADTTLDWLKATLDVRQSAFILLTPQDDRRLELRVLRATAKDLPSPQLFDAASRFILHFYKARQPLSQYDLDMLSWFQAMSPDERQWLKGLALDLYIPILVAEKPVALLALGPKAGGQPYADEDVETLMILAGLTGTALENARLMDDLRAVQDDLHRLSTQLAETNQQLKRLDQTKTDFITIASHELRTPLTQIYGYSDILTRLNGDDLSDAQVLHQFIEGITRGASRLKRVLDAMIDVSLIETGAMKIYPVDVPVTVVIQNAVETVRANAYQRQLDFVVNDLSHLPYVQADSARLEQAFVSLLSNAVKFTPDGGKITVSGRLAVTSATEAYVELSVADTGIGIDPGEQALIFEKFHRAEEVLHHSSDDIAFKGAGPGLGLSIAKGIIEAHGGRIWVESPGRDEQTCPGSTFYVRLPVKSHPQERDHG